MTVNRMSYRGRGKYTIRTSQRARGVGTRARHSASQTRGLPDAENGMPWAHNFRSGTDRSASRFIHSVLPASTPLRPNAGSEKGGLQRSSSSTTLQLALSIAFVDRQSLPPLLPIGSKLDCILAVLLAERSVASSSCSSQRWHS